MPPLLLLCAASLVPSASMFFSHTGAGGLYGFLNVTVPAAMSNPYSLRQMCKMSQIPQNAKLRQNRIRKLSLSLDSTETNVHIALRLQAEGKLLDHSMLCNPDMIEQSLANPSTALPLDKSMPSRNFASAFLRTIALILGFLCMTPPESHVLQMHRRLSDSPEASIVRGKEMRSDI
jgi:hypothetical protein